jgi:uncharacterized protein YbjT (DUF2867 family)
MSRPPLLVFGPRNGVGFELAALARMHGWPVIAAVRPGADATELEKLGCRVMEADALDAPSVRAVFQDLPSDVMVASTLGDRNGVVDDEGNRAVIDAATEYGTARLLLISSLGAGESRRYASERLLAAIGDVLHAKTRAEARLRASGLPFTIIRPGGLVDGAATGTGKLVDAEDAHGSISRAELAALTLRTLRTDTFIGRTLSAIDPAHEQPHPRI